MRFVREPTAFLLIGLILLLVPAALGLVHLYEEARQHHSTRDLPSLPSSEALLDMVRQFDKELVSPRLEAAYQSSPLPRSGLLAVYKVSDLNRPIYRLAVVRHDIPCDSCRDLLVGVFLAPEEERIIGIESLEPWELAEGVVDPNVFLSQLSGRSLPDSLRVGPELDGMTGASLSVQALLTELWGLGQRAISSVD